jgi:NAD(P)-dependent dehydrogenase (short-subunit alcohol dehydrogenase family)
MHNGGSIVLGSSGVQLKGIPFYKTYGATKAALRFWARSMGHDRKSFNKTFGTNVRGLLSLFSKRFP